MNKMVQPVSQSSARLNLAAPKSRPMLSLFLVATAIWIHASSALAQTARVSDAFWTFEQDCDGDANKAGALVGNFARLNWFPDVNNCNGTLNVFEVISYRLCSTTQWTPLYTNATHTIVGCSVPNQRYVDIEMGTNGECRDYKIEIFRVGQSIPDGIRSSTNDIHLSQHKEEALVEDTCANDAFESCVFLSGTVGTRSDNTSTATKQISEPNHANNPGGHSLWYCWTATTNSPVTFDTTGSGFDTLLAVYTGASLNSLTVVTNMDDIAGATNRMSRLTFTPVTGTTYRIAVDGFGGASGVMELNWNQAGTALPDLIVWGPGAQPSITTETLSAGSCMVLEGCATAGTRKLIRFNMETRNIGLADLNLGIPITNSLYRFATCHGHYHFESFAQYTLLDTNLNPVMLGTNVVVGRKVGFCVLDFFKWRPDAAPTKKFDCANTPQALTNATQGIQAGWGDVYDKTLDCQFIDVTGVPSGDYLLQIAVNPDNVLTEADYSNNRTLIEISIPPDTCVTNPPNDSFTNALVVSTTPYTDSQFTTCATKQSGEPNHVNRSGTHSIWYSWTPASNHTAVINTRRSTFDTVLAVYTGNSVGALTQVATNDDISTSINQSQLSFNAIAGTTYRIAIDGFSTSVGDATINIDPPGNDLFANRYLISGTVGTTNGSSFAASKEGTNETAHAFEAGGRSIWYRWVAPATGFVDFNTKGSTFDTLLAVYTNSIMTASNIPVAANDDDAQGGGLQTSRLFFFAQAGTNYDIAIDGFAGEAGDIKLNWNMDCKLAITNLPNGNVQLSLTGVDWQRYVLLGTTNFTDWYTNTAAITMADGIHFYTNSIGTTNNPATQQFFRAVRVP